MRELHTMKYEVTGRIARITLDRPARGNGITLEMPGELAACVERANLDPSVHVIALAGNGKGFCGGDDLVASPPPRLSGTRGPTPPPPPRPPPPPLVAPHNHHPNPPRGPAVGCQMIRRHP